MAMAPYSISMAEWPTPKQLQVEPGQSCSMVSFMNTRFFMLPGMPLAQPMQNWKCRGAFSTPFFK